MQKSTDQYHTKNIIKNEQMQLILNIEHSMRIATECRHKMYYHLLGCCLSLAETHSETGRWNDLSLCSVNHQNNRLFQAQHTSRTSRYTIYKIYTIEEIVEKSHTLDNSFKVQPRTQHTNLLKHTGLLMCNQLIVQSCFRQHRQKHRRLLGIAKEGEFRDMYTVQY